MLIEWQKVHILYTHPCTWSPLHYKCSKHFCKMIRNPELLIPAVLYLADSRSSGLKAALVKVMTEEKGKPIKANV